MMNTPLKLPYGLCDFYSLITEGYFYVDRTAYLATLEEAGRHLLFLRPRRFGKSLLLSTLENYYDVAKANQFEALFGALQIGKHPTPRHNTYFILRWDFSMVKATGDVNAVEMALYDHLNVAIRSFALKYRSFLPQEPVIYAHNAVASLQTLVAIIQQTPYRLYLLIDEYDNFANEVLMVQLRGQTKYDALVHGEGILKTVFKAVKALSAGQGLERVFITGVSPIVMSDISSGYNIAKDISQQPEYYDLCGFQEPEMQTALQTVIQVCGWPASKLTEVLQLMRTFYNGYRFGYPTGELVYNPTLALYFLEHLQRNGAYPRAMLDSNLAMDRNRIDYVARLPHGEPLIGKTLNSEQPILLPELASRFGVDDMLRAPKDQVFLASLLYYFGVLTIANYQDPLGRLALTIPNLVIRKLYVERLQEALLPSYEDREQIRAVAEQFYSTGELAPVCELVETRYFQVFDNRDYRWSNELVVKTAFLVLLFSDTFYLMDSETAIAKGYADLTMLVRPDRRQYQLLDHILEFKYVSLKDLGLSAAEVKSRSREDLTQLPLVQQQLTAANAQLQRYRATLQQVYGNTLRLHTHAVVTLGLERLVWD